MLEFLPEKKGSSNCKGDSGGPVLAKGLNNELGIVGVQSYAEISCEKLTGAADARAYRAWICDGTQCPNAISLR